MDKTYMVYSLFYCSLLLALFPLFGSSTTRSSPPSHTLQALPTLAPYRTTTRSSQPSHAPQALSNLASHRATARSSPPSHAPQALPPLAPYRTTTCSLPRHHSLHATLPRPKIPLITPCFVTRNIMAEGAKKHDDFRLPT